MKATRLRYVALCSVAKSHCTPTILRGWLFHCCFHQTHARSNSICICIFCVLIFIPIHTHILLSLFHFWKTQSHSQQSGGALVVASVEGIVTLDRCDFSNNQAVSAPAPPRRYAIREYVARLASQTEERFFLNVTTSTTSRHVNVPIPFSQLSFSFISMLLVSFLPYQYFYTVYL
jgi:hypothetical protein